MKVLVTGAAGLLGSRFIGWMLANKPEAYVIGVDDLSGGFMENLPKCGAHFDFIIDSVEDNSIENIFKQHQIDYVVHFAAYAAECLSPFTRKFNYTNNLLATANLINLSIKYGVKRFVFTSSMAVYGNQTPPFTEKMIPCPVDPYGIAKYACEMDLRVAGDQHGLDWTIIRPHNVYGRNQNIWDSYRNVIGIWMWKHLNGYDLSIFGDGAQRRAFSYIDDSLEPLWVAMTDPKTSKQIINLGGVCEYTINETAHTLLNVMGSGKILHLPPRHEVKYAWSTWEKSVELLGFSHKTTLYNGMKDMWEWAQKQPKRERFVWSNYEIDKGLYPYWTQENLIDPSKLKG